MRIDLNADLGEGYGVWQLGADAELLDLVTSANVACGFHGGDPSIMARTCVAAAARQVAIGAQVSYPDLVGFGRRPMAVAPADLHADVLYQLGALDAFARVAGTRVRYVKPHGALYATVTVDDAAADAVAAAVAAYDPTLPVLGPPASALAAAAEARGIGFVVEGFADRAYQPDGRLVPRAEPGSVYDHPAAAAAQAVALATQHQVTAVDGRPVAVAAESICVHGDSPGAVALARAVREALARAGVDLQPFVP